MLRIFVNTWGNYNIHGADGGRWLDLPMDEEELEKTLAEIAEAMNDSDPEFCIHDYEWATFAEQYGYANGIHVDENSNIAELNEMAQTIEDLDDYELEIIGAMMSEGYTLEQAIENKDDCIVWSDCEDMEDVARAYAEETGLLDSIPDNLRSYFDFESFGRDMGFEGHFVFVDNDCIEICA